MDISKKIEKYLKNLNEGSEIKYGNVGSDAVHNPLEGILNKLDLELATKLMAELKVVTDKVERVLKNADQGFDANGKYTEPKFTDMMGKVNEMQAIWKEIEAKVVKSSVKKA